MASRFPREKEKEEREIRLTWTKPLCSSRGTNLVPYRSLASSFVPSWGNARVAQRWRFGKERGPFLEYLPVRLTAAGVYARAFHAPRDPRSRDLADRAKVRKRERNREKDGDRGERSEPRRTPLRYALVNATAAVSAGMKKEVRDLRKYGL